jgi:orotate phosphoribosyltransferase
MHLPQEIRRVAQLTGRFTLRSGQVSETYFDKYRFEADPQLLWNICTEMATLIPAEVDVLAGLELGGIPLFTLLSQMTGLPAAFLRKEAKSYGTCRYAEGADLPGKRVLLIEDVVSSGGAILEAASKLRADGIPIDTALCVIDRETGGAASLAAAGIRLLSLYRMHQITQAT